jgi:hypothetical protein
MKKRRNGAPIQEGLFVQEITGAFFADAHGSCSSLYDEKDDPSIVVFQALLIQRYMAI